MDVVIRKQSGALQILYLPICTPQNPLTEVHFQILDHQHGCPRFPIWTEYDSMSEDKGFSECAKLGYIILRSLHLNSLTVPYNTTEQHLHPQTFKPPTSCCMYSAAASYFLVARLRYLIS
jgi:hypothetical protein